MTTEELIRITLEDARPAPTYGLQIPHDAVRQMNQECFALGLGNIASVTQLDGGVYYVFHYFPGPGYFGNGSRVEVEAIITRLGGTSLRHDGAKVYFYIFDEEPA